jgi:hypothetical protein
MTPALLAPTLSTHEVPPRLDYEVSPSITSGQRPWRTVKLAEPSPNASHVALARVEIRQATGNASKIIPERHAGTRLAYQVDVACYSCSCILCQVATPLQSKAGPINMDEQDYLLGSDLSWTRVCRSTRLATVSISYGSSYRLWLLFPGILEETHRLSTLSDVPMSRATSVESDLPSCQNVNGFQTTLS